MQLGGILSFDGRAPIFMGGDPGNHTRQFDEALKGLRLPNMPGYPSDTRLMPQMQLSPNQRLCFYSWPDNDVWAGITQNQEQILVDTPGFDYWDSILGDANSAKVYEQHTTNLGYFFKVPVLPTDLYLVKEYIKSGSPYQAASASHLGAFNVFTGGFIGAGNYYNRATVTSTWKNSNPPGGFYSPWTGLNIVSFNGEFFYRAVSNLNMVWLNVQFQVDKFLNAPYCVKELVPYGMSYNKWLNEIFKYGDKEKLKLFLSNVNFFYAPESKKSFWDKLLNLVPVVVATAFVVVSMGAGTPALVAVVAAYFGKLALTDWQKKHGYEMEQIREQNEKKELDEILRGNLPGGIKNDSGGAVGLGNGIIIGGSLLFLLLLLNKKR